MKFRDAFNRHILLLGILIGIAGLIAGTETLLDMSHEIIEQVESVITGYPVLGKLLFVLLALASAMFAFFSSAILTPIGIYTWGPVETFVLLWIGWLLGGMISFAVGRYLGRSVVTVLLGESRLSSWETQVDRHTKFIHILLFQAAVPSEIPGYVLGILRYRFPLYLAALAITELPYALGTVFLGESFLKGDSMLFVAIGAGTILLSVIAFQTHRRVALRQESSTEK
ncbi:MAG: VTT domain-containing protein [Gammaproteobacteria bacterium]|nr:VTT domain-containing protein [Gammaproteobacteria bacterium]